MAYSLTGEPFNRKNVINSSYLIIISIINKMEMHKAASQFNAYVKSKNQLLYH